MLTIPENYPDQTEKCPRYNCRKTCALLQQNLTFQNFQLGIGVELGKPILWGGT